jgi:hypothetical protein
MKDRYDRLVNEIKKFEEDFESNESLFGIKQKYYRGIQVLFSPLYFKPKFLFIGINPGVGYFNDCGQHVKRFDALDHFEYLHYDYQLAREIRKVFEIANLGEELKQSVKTNCYFFSTTTEKELHKFLSHLKEDYKIYNKSRGWFKELIEITQPQIIICEGKSVFEELIGREKEKVQDFDGVFKSFYNNVPVIGFRRRRSYIVNKNDLGELIKQTHNELSLPVNSILNH